jgi:hypothetical protein
MPIKALKTCGIKINFFVEGSEEADSAEKALDKLNKAAAKIAENDHNIDCSKLKCGATKGNPTGTCFTRVFYGRTDDKGKVSYEEKDGAWIMPKPHLVGTVWKVSWDDEIQVQCSCSAKPAKSPGTAVAPNAEKKAGGGGDDAKKDAGGNQPKKEGGKAD